MAEVKHATIHIVDGQEKGDAAQILVQPAGKRTPRPGETLVLFLDLPNASSSVCADASRTLSDAFWRAPGGVTTALRLAMKLANDRLVELNRGVPASQQVQGSISCAVVNEQSLILAQAGAAVAFARSQSGAFERIEPRGSKDVIGVSHVIEPAFNHFAWQPNDVYVLTGSASCAQVGDPLIEACMGKGDARMVAGYLNANIKQGRMMGVAVSIEGRPAVEPAAPIAAPAASGATAAMAREPAPPAGGASMTQTLSTVGANATAAMSNAARSVQRSLSAFGAQLLPAQSKPAAAERSRTALFLLAAVAVLLPIVVAVIVSLLYYQFSGEAERQQLQNAARARIEAAQTSTDPAKAKDNWGRALDAIAAYEDKRPDDRAMFADDRLQAYAQIDQANKITRITPVDLAELSPAAGGRKVAAASLGIYLLDTGANATQYYGLTPTRDGVDGSPVPLQTGAGITATESALRDLAWASPGSNRWRTEGAVLFGDDALHEYNASTGRTTPIELPPVANTSPDQVAAGELYNYTAYLLDTGVGQIWRFTYENNIFTRADTYFRSPFSTLRDGVDLVIDGAIYVLTRNGTVYKFFNRAPVPFNVTNLPVPLGNPIALAVSGTDQNNGNVFIADAGNGAIFVLNKTGAFVKQYRAIGDAFVDMQDMSIDPTSNTLYIVTPTHLYSLKVD